MEGNTAITDRNHPPQTACVTITEPLGLHLRAGSDLVQVANRFAASITAENLSHPNAVANVKSIVQVMQLQARHGHVLRLSAAGPDAGEAMHPFGAVCATGRLKQVPVQHGVIALVPAVRGIIRT